MSNLDDVDGEEWWIEAVGYQKEISPKVRAKAVRRKLYEVLKLYGYNKPKGFGKEWLRCPFHDDRKASAAVDWTSNYFTCFTCEMSGSAIDLVMKKEGVTRDEAIQRIESL